MSAELKGPQELRTEVVERQLCTLCGACVGMCPYLVAHRGRVVVMDDCNLSEGRCYSFCPRGSVDPDEVSDPSLKQDLSRTKCLAMLYEGPDAIGKIRWVLGSTDPMKAAPATVRSEFGRDLMRNGAHASDSVASSERERKIIGMWEATRPSDITRVIRAYLEGQAP